MALVIREWCKPKSTPPCYKCQDRAVGCHSNCQKHAEWKREDVKRKREFKEHNKKIKCVEDYVVKQKQKHKKAWSKQWRGMPSL